MRPRRSAIAARSSVVPSSRALATSASPDRSPHRRSLRRERSGRAGLVGAVPPAQRPPPPTAPRGSRRRSGSPSGRRRPVRPRCRRRRTRSHRRRQEAPGGLQIALVAAQNRGCRRHRHGRVGRRDPHRGRARRGCPRRRVGPGDDVHCLKWSGFRSRWQGCHLRHLGGASITAPRALIGAQLPGQLQRRQSSRRPHRRATRTRPPLRLSARRSSTSRRERRSRPGVVGNGAHTIRPIAEPSGSPIARPTRAIAPAWTNTIAELSRGRMPSAGGASQCRGAVGGRSMPACERRHRSRGLARKPASNSGIVLSSLSSERSFGVNDGTGAELAPPVCRGARRRPEGRHPVVVETRPKWNRNPSKSPVNVSGNTQPPVRVAVVWAGRDERDAADGEGFGTLRAGELRPCRRRSTAACSADSRRQRDLRRGRGQTALRDHDIDRVADGLVGEQRDRAGSDCSRRHSVHPSHRRRPGRPRWS